MVKRDKPTVALFGGSFDPPHKGHQKIVDLALKSLDIDYLVIMPTYLNPFKEKWHTPPNIRFKWTQELFEDNKKVIVSEYEIEENKSVPTYQSISHLSKIYSIKYLIIGSDNLKSLTKWYNFEWLNQNITWVIFTRKGYDIDTDRLNSFKILDMDIDISSTQIRNGSDRCLIDKKILDSVNQFYKGTK